MDIARPLELKKPLMVKNNLLMGAGPGTCSPRIFHALSQPVVLDDDADLKYIMEEIKAGLRYLFQTSNEFTLALSTSGNGGMDATLCNLVEEGDVVLVAVNGFWGGRATDMAARYGADVRTMTTELGKSFTLNEIEAAILKHKPALFFIVQGESSTGILQQLDGVGDICHRNNCLLMVDSVASLGGVPMFVDRWGLDAVYSGSQKVLGAPPGITPLTLSPRALQKIRDRKTHVRTFYFDLMLIGDAWSCFSENSDYYHHTMCVSLLYALRESLAIIVEEGLENVLRRHQECAKILHEGLEHMGFQLFVANKSERLTTITSVYRPDNVNWDDVTKYALKEYSLIISNGLGRTEGKIFRIGIMGYNAQPEKMEFVMKVLKEAVQYTTNKNIYL